MPIKFEKMNEDDTFLAEDWKEYWDSLTQRQKRWLMNKAREEWTTVPVVAARFGAPEMEISNKG